MNMTTKRVLQRSEVQYERDIHVALTKIDRASKRGTGTRLSAEQVRCLAWGLSNHIAALADAQEDACGPSRNQGQGD